MQATGLLPIYVDVVGKKLDKCAEAKDCVHVPSSYVHIVPMNINSLINVVGETRQSWCGACCKAGTA